MNSHSDVSSHFQGKIGEPITNSSHVFTNSVAMNIHTIFFMKFYLFSFKAANRLFSWFKQLNQHLPFCSIAWSQFKNEISWKKYRIFVVIEFVKKYNELVHGVFVKAFLLRPSVIHPFFDSILKNEQRRKIQQCNLPWDIVKVFSVFFFDQKKLGVILVIKWF
jgi:hypothetical protein